MRYDRGVRRRWRVCGLVALAFGAVRCGLPPGPSDSPSSSTPRGEITDPAGDALSDARVRVAPDLIRASAEVTGGNINFVIQFAPGTFDPQTTRVSVLLDTDVNMSTGIAQRQGLGADYGIDLAAATALANVTKADPAGCAAQLSCFNVVGSAPITIATDSMQVAVPLSLIGSADGRMTFAMNSYVLVATATAVVFDFMPDANQSPARVQ
jgi:hypothetical protein